MDAPHEGPMDHSVTETATSGRGEHTSSSSRQRGPEAVARTASRQSCLFDPLGVGTSVAPQPRRRITISYPSAWRVIR